ncbi:unnamed protein product [Urochloa decumbens]|uniref:Cyclin N-terminal domain-containing protein n=1 Tax=Urochloa decumbens TaxID=240449 RepID=A0ABC9HBM1_9POAL
MSRAVAGPLMREDGRGIPRSLPLLAALVEAEAQSAAAAAAARPTDSGLVRAFRRRCCCCADAAESDLVRSFRGGAAPKVPIRTFLERIHQLTRIDGNCFVLAGIYLTRFIPSADAMEAGILVEPATVHRLVAVAVLLGAKFAGHSPVKWTRVFQDSSEGAIRAGEMADLEGCFLRAIDFRLFVDRAGFDSFCKILERGPWVPSAEGGCACKKRQADAVAGEEDDCKRLVSATSARQTRSPERTSAAASLLPLPAVLSH